MTRLQAIKKFFGDKVPVTNNELFALKALTPEGKSYITVLGDDCLMALGETLTEN